MSSKAIFLLVLSDLGIIVLHAHNRIRVRSFFIKHLAVQRKISSKNRIDRHVSCSPFIWIK